MRLNDFRSWIFFVFIVKPKSLESPTLYYTFITVIKNLLTDPYCTHLVVMHNKIQWQDGQK